MATWCFKTVVHRPESDVTAQAPQTWLNITRNYTLKTWPHPLTFLSFFKSSGGCLTRKTTTPMIPRYLHLLLPPPQRLCFHPRPFVVWLVCKQDDTKSTKLIWTKLRWGFGLGPKQTPLIFGVEPHEESDPGIVFTCLWFIPVPSPTDHYIHWWLLINRCNINNDVVPISSKMLWYWASHLWSAFEKI